MKKKIILSIVVIICVGFVGSCINSCINYKETYTKYYDAIYTGKLIEIEPLSEHRYNIYFEDKTFEDIYVWDIAEFSVGNICILWRSKEQIHTYMIDKQ